MVVVGMLLLVASYRLARRYHSAGHVVFTDTRTEAYIPHGLLVDISAGLAARADGLLKDLEKRQIIPVLVIEDVSGLHSPTVPDRLRLVFLCRLTRQFYHQSVPYGLLRYADRDLECSITPDLESTLDDLLRSMRSDALALDVVRTHNESGICAHCPVRDECNQALE
jgi:hypothetical protein